MKYQHIVFDLDGTLLDTEYGVLHSFQDTLLEVTGRRNPLNELTFCLGITGEDALVQLNIENVPSVLALWIEKLNTYENTVCPFPEIPELISSLASKGYQFGIVTSKTRNEFEKQIRNYEFHKYLSTTVCAEDTDEHKPTAAPLLKYMELTGCSKDELLYVGDSRYDSECARNAGADFALATWGTHSPELPAEYYPKSPLELLSL